MSLDCRVLDVVSLERTFTGTGAHYCVTADLKAVGIKPHVDLPVGDDLQDHPGILLSYFTDSSTLFRAGTAEDVQLFEQSGRGPLSSNVSEGGGFFRTDSSMELPDIFFNAGPVMFYDEGLSQPFDDAYVFGPVVLKPTSRGTVKLRGARPDAKPRIFNNFLATEEDRRSMIRGVQLTMDVAQRPALAAVCRAPHLVPASSSDADVWSFIERHTQTFYHPASTCGAGRVVERPSLSNSSTRPKIAVRSSRAAVSLASIAMPTAIPMARRIWSATSARKSSATASTPRRCAA
jgi:choline dehydrogenase